MKKKSLLYAVAGALFWIMLPMLWTGCGPVKRCLDDGDCVSGQEQCLQGLCQPINGGGTTCTQDGKTYKPGDTFPSPDGCNTCSCGPKGQIACTLRACVKDCTYEGKTYQLGATFPASDGCNTCTCGQNGAVSCTEKACPKTCTHNGKTYNVGDTFPAGDNCNTCSCDPNGQVVCTRKACPPPTGCNATNTCPPNSVCVYNTGVCKPGSNDRGTCAVLSQPCDAVYKPVCGCNGKTYGNACEARSAGVTIEKEGECKTAPGSCTHDGKTYKDGDTWTDTDGCNSCTCSNGQVACTGRVCNEVCGGLAGIKCKNPDEYCYIAKGCGFNDGTGVCKPKPKNCTEEYAPVCGCDGKTYGNACAAASAGVSVQAIGECKSTGACGTRGGKTCAANEYCDQPSHCGATDIGGTCKPKPTACTDHIEYVCGCDGKTYSNPCEAAAKGVSVKTKGKCPTTGTCTYNGKTYKAGDTFPSTDGCNTCSCGSNGAVACTQRACSKQCGGIAGIKCSGTNEFCDYGSHCGATDQMGTCRTKPQACTQQYDPVCGCDGKTYGNACSAASSGASVQHKGECKTAGTCQYNGKTYKVGDTFPSTDGCNTCSCGQNGAVACTKKACAQACGGLAGLKCSKAGDYCKYGSHCGWTDQTGICTPKPQGCTQQYDPVCGCDGKTYGNACSAASVGVSVRSKGECKTAGTCTYNGKTYKAGDTFPSSDGCNTCSCGSSGQITCTTRACAKQCGGIAGLTCSGTNEYCAKKEGACLIPDSMGTCQQKPQACTQQYDPVCGCDGKTYGNACSAANSGVSVAKKGACAP